MKKLFTINLDFSSILILIVILLIFASSCKKDNDDNNNDNIIGSFTDSRDGTVYKTISIGNQVWMAENLKYLPNVVDPSIGSYSNPYYYVYEYDGSNVSTAKATTNYDNYGVLYNWTAAMDGAASSNNNPSGVQGVCPSGWHLPSDAEWTELINYLGGSTVAGGKLKEEGYIHWNNPNTDATNESGFNALPSGYRENPCWFKSLGDFGCFWTTSSACYWRLNYNNSNANRMAITKDAGLCVRCVKD